VSELAEAGQWPLGDEVEQICVRNLLGATDEIIYFKDLQSRFIYLSKGWAAIHGQDPRDLLGLTDFDVFTPEHAASAFADEQRIIATGVAMVNKEEKETWPNRPDTWVASTKLPLRDTDGRIIGTFGISRDITRLVLAEQAATRNAAALSQTHAELSQVEARLRTVLDTSPDAISLYDAKLRYQYINAAGERMTHDASADLLGRTDRERGRDEAFLTIWEASLRAVLTTGVGCAVDFSVGDSEGLHWFQSHLAPQCDTRGAVPTGVVTSTREVTELRCAQDRIAHQAVHDPLTELPNRVLLMDRLAQALMRMEREPSQLAVLFIDLDHFKEINDTYGHGAGDRLLIEIGRRLSALSRRVDTVARLGGDEFVILCDNLRTDEDARVIADRVVRSVVEPFIDNGCQLQVSASVGVVVTADPYAGGENLLRDADAAMYQAKNRGRNHFQFFDASLRDRAAARNVIELDLARALDREEFRLEYQPVFALHDQHIVGLEALIRWDHPERGTVPPVEFIGIAEDRGLILPIGAWVLNEACRQVIEWDAVRDPADTPLTVAVNVSGRQLQAADFVCIVKSALERHHLQPGRLCLEITETALIEDAADPHDRLEELAALGVHIALDDFGTGHSSLARLREFPVDILKIDRSFVDRLETNDRERQIVAAVTAMAHVLGMKVVGEGIETVGQLNQLANLGCDDGQGFLLSRPLRPRAVAEMLQPKI
jgi:diguanylate cyclase (GGDEF)-like protein/PAS domain S-box-containing protein